MKRNALRRHGTLRALLLALFLAASLGTAAELLLLEHTESWEQLVPLAVLAAGLAAGVWVALRPTRPAVRLFQGVMAGFLLSGLVGLYLHYRGNVEFELEMYPSLDGFELFWKALRGATPALAPATMAWLGLLGLAFTYGHPAARAAGSEPSIHHHEKESPG